MPPRLVDALAGRYRVEREVGAGGMATVFLAEDLRHDRKVALKVLRPELAAIIGAERFLAEIRTTAHLQHPHILPLFDSGEAEGYLYYVMPFVAGESLRARLARETQLPIPEALRITREVGSALDYAHRRGVVHRDIKPENILLQEGTALVADFGIALAVATAGGTRLTQTGLSLGTPGYMSPEQAAGERTVDARSDVYALGAVCYEMLTGQPPFVAPTTQALIAKLMTEDPVPPSRSRRSVPPQVDAAILAALEKLPADRPSTPAELITALTREDSQPSGGRRLPSRRGILAGLAAGALGGLVLGGVGVTSLQPHASAAEGEGRRAQITFSGQASSPAISPDGNFIAFVAASCGHAHVDLCRSSLAVQEVGSTQAVPILTGAEWLLDPRWSHDGTTIVVRGQLDSARTGVFAIPRLGGSPRLVAEADAFDTHPAGDSLVTVVRQSDSVALLRIIALSPGRSVDSFTVPGNASYSGWDVSWAPNGRSLALITGPRRLDIVGRRGELTGSTRLQIRPHVRWTRAGDAVLAFRVGIGREDELVSLGIDPAGRVRGEPRVELSRLQTLYRGRLDVSRGTGRLAIATGVSTADLWTFDFTNDAVVGRRRTQGTTWYGKPALSPNGTQLMYLRGDAIGDNVYVTRLSDGIEEALTSERLPAVFDVELSADGRRLAFEHSTDSTIRLAVLELPSRRIMSRESGAFPSRAVPLGTHALVGYSPTGRGLAVLDSLRATIWRPLPIPDSHAIFTFAPSPDGEEIAFLTRTGVATNLFTLSLDRSTLQLVHSFPDEGTTALAWNKEGIHVGRWLPSDELPSLWRVTESGKLTRVASLTAPCAFTDGLALAAASRVAACSVLDNRSDIWVFDGVGGSQIASRP
jgi:dipeptidyl aminopeptidase/acylaminoacyl peptidase